MFRTFLERSLNSLDSDRFALFEIQMWTSSLHNNVFANVWVPFEAFACLREVCIDLGHLVRVLLKGKHTVVCYENSCTHAIVQPGNLGCRRGCFLPTRHSSCRRGLGRTWSGVPTLAGRGLKTVDLLRLLSWCCLGPHS